MNVIFTQHASERLLQRRVSEEDVKLTIANPDSLEEGRGNTRVVTKSMGRRQLRVVYTVLPGEYLVITVYWT